METAQFKFFKIALLLAINFLACGSLSVKKALPRPEGFPEVSLLSSKVKDGSLLWLELKNAEPELQARAVYESQEAPFFKSDQSWIALIGVPHSTKVGGSGVTIEVTRDGKKIAYEMPFEVIEGQYKSEILKVDPKLVNPPKKAMARIKRESTEIGAIYRNWTAKKYWKGPFVFPVASAMTSPFGTKRLYNGETQGFHQGLDLKAQIGTPINAPAPGKVVLSKNLYFTGYTVLLDHGLGLFTVYGHMSKLKVKRGQEVKAGQLLGLAGMTGRSNGPHLHWGAVVNRVKIDPLDLIQVVPR
jgi:murein DD-endopeptidase MepM/ murein hydrolase activator NlpD